MNSIEAGLAISQATQRYYPEMVKTLNDRLGDKFIRFDYGTHDNYMPLYLVGNARKVMLFTWLNGDNYREAMAEIALGGGAFRDSPDAAGANAEELIIFLPFADFRGHKKTRKSIPDSIEKAIVRAEGLTNPVLVRLLKYAACASGVVTVDAHNLWETGQQFAQEELPLINLTTNQLFVNHLLANNLLEDNLETIVASADIGDLPTAYDLSKRLGKALDRDDSLPLAIYLKERIGRETHQRLITKAVQIGGKRVIVAEDMISSAGTVEETINNLLEQGAAEVIFYAPHAVFVKDYYKKMEKLLSDSRVKIIISDSLPFVRDIKTVAIPYGETPEGRNETQIIKIGDWLAEKAEIILTAENLEAARELLRNEITEPVNPYDFLLELTGERISPPADGAIYKEGITMPLPQRTILFEETS